MLAHGIFWAMMSSVFARENFERNFQRKTFFFFQRSSFLEQPERSSGEKCSVSTGYYPEHRAIGIIRMWLKCRCDLIADLNTDSNADAKEPPSRRMLIMCVRYRRLANWGTQSHQAFGTFCLSKTLSNELLSKRDSVVNKALSAIPFRTVPRSAANCGWCVRLSRRPAIPADETN